jgi:RHS repeat-associated protein
MRLMIGMRRSRQTVLFLAIIVLGTGFSHGANAQTCTYWSPNTNGALEFPSAQAVCQSFNETTTSNNGLTSVFEYEVGPLAQGPPAQTVYWCSATVTTTGSEYNCNNGGSYCGTVFVARDNQADENQGCTNAFFIMVNLAQNQTCSDDCVSDPINPANGNVYAMETDIKFSAASAINYKRFYNSADTNGIDGVPGWRHSYDKYVNAVYAPPAIFYPGQSVTVSPQYSTAAAACTSGFPTVKSSVAQWANATASYNGGVCVVSVNGTTVATLVIYSLYLEQAASTPIEYDVIREDGQTIRFTTQNAAINSQLGVSLRFAVTGSGYTVTDDNDNVESYNSAGILQSITARSGVAQTLTYDSNGLFAGVSDSFGNSLTVTRNAAGSIEQIATSGGGTVQYGYDGYYRLSTVTNLDGTTRSYTYGNPTFLNALTALTDESGTQMSSWTYDSQERATSTQEAGGAGASSITYNSNGTVTWQDALGAQRIFSYSRMGDINQVTSISGSQCPTCQESAATTYDAAGWVESRIDYNGNLTCYANDEIRGLELVRVEGFAPGSSCPSNLASYSPASGTAQRKISTVWNASFRVPGQITEALRTMAFTYDSDGNALTKTVTDTSVTPNVARTWTYTYTSYGQVLTTKGPRTDVNGTTTFTYYTCTTGSQCGQVHTVTDAVGNVTTFNTYNTYGEPVTLTDANGVITTLTYDARARLTSRQVGTETTAFAYYPTGLLQKTTLPDGGYIQYTYDAAHRLTKIQDGMGNSIQYVLDALGNHTAVSAYDPSNVLSRTQSRVYNTLSELYQVIGSAGTSAVTSTYGYDGNGNPTSIQAPLSRDTSYAVDALNRIIQVTDPKTGVTTFGYDSNNDLMSVKDPAALTTSYLYDGLGDLLQSVSPATGTTTNTYDLAENLATTTDARGLGPVYSYDAANRVTQMAYGDQTIALTYDAGNNGKGRLTGASDASHSMGWQYDALGRVNLKSQTVAGVTKSVGYSYTNGDLITLTTPSGQTVVYSYSNHQVTGISVNGTTLLSGVVYDPFGPTRGWSWGNGTTEIRLRDTDGNPSQITGIESVSYTIDSAFRIEGISNASNASLSWTDGYDSLDRLTSASQTAGSLAWTYDAEGNRLSQSGAPAPSYATSSLGMTYNHRGRMTAVNASNTTTNYVYNALGQRIEKLGVSEILYWYDEAGHLLGEYNSAGVLVQETVWLGNLPVATLRPNGSGVNIYYIHADHLGTPKMITRSADNAIMWRWDQDPFGIAAPNQNPSAQGAFIYNPRFPGQYFDGETGLTYNYSRDYDPQVGRYVESDPIGLRGGSYSTYAYVGGNPISLVDPSGLCSQDSSHAYKISIWTPCDARVAFSEFTNPWMSGPGAPQITQAGPSPTIMLWGNNPIWQDTDPNTLTITNTTQQGHQFDPGQVVINVTPAPIGSVITVTGTGTGGNPYFNDAIGYAYFGLAALLAAFLCSH